MKLAGLLRYIPKTTLLIVIGVSALAGLANVAIVALISQRLASGDSFTGTFVLQFAAVVLAVVGLDFGVKWLLLRMTASTVYGLRADLTKQILQAPMAELERIGAPRLLAALTDDVHTLSIALNQMPTIAMSVAILVGSFVYLAWLSPPTLLLAAALILPAIVGQIWLRNKASRSRKEAFRARDELFGQYRMLTDGAKELKMHRERRNAFLDSLIMPTASRYEALSLRSRSLHLLATSWMQAVYFLFVLAIFALASIWGLSQEVLTSFALIALYARTSMNGLFVALPFLSDAAIAGKQLELIGMDLVPDSADPLSEPCESEMPICIRMHELRHTYWVDNEERAFDLGPIDLEFESGELVFLIGGNGSGKTTLAKLLLGLYTPGDGEIEWNDQPMTARNIDDYRQLFSVIFADFFLFDQLLGLADVANDGHVQEYLKKLRLDRKVEIVDGKLSTLDLSTGQRQRLALLTAYLEDRPVYLFDEWAAGQDPQFKELFYRQLLPELRNRGKLVIVISHDDHYYDVADRIIKLDSGQIEYDTPM